MDDISNKIRELEETNHRLGNLLSYSNGLLSINNLTELFNKLSTTSVDLLACEALVVYIFDQEQNAISPHLVTHTKDAEIEDITNKESFYSITDEKYQNSHATTTTITGVTNKTGDIVEAISPIFSITDSATITNKFNLKCAITTQLSTNNKTLGALTLLLAHKNITELTESDYQLISFISATFATALNNILTYKFLIEHNQSLYSKNKELDAIFEITNQIVSTLNPYQVALRTVNFIPSQMGYAGAILTEINEKEEKCKVLAMSDNILKQLENNNSNKTEFVCDITKHNQHLVMFDRDNFVVSDKIFEATEPVIPKTIAEYLQTSLNIKTAINVPVNSKDTLIGVVTFLLFEDAHTLTSNDYDLMQIFASEIAIGLENAKLLDTYQVLLKELKTKNTQLEDYAQKERDIMDILGHELRTPITIVRNYLSVLIDKLRSGNPLEPNELSEFLDKAYKSTKREMALIETMLCATKLDSNKLELNKINIDPAELINKSIENEKENAAQKGLKLVFANLNQNLPEIYADRTRMQQIIDSLLNNAVKYTETGQVELTVLNNGETVRFEISDTGPGIPQSDIDKLGTKFYRVAQYGITAKASEELNIVRPGGSGLGLYVAFELIKLHGGEIQVTSEIGKGTKFSFSVPVFKGEVQTSPTTKSKNLFDNYRKRKLDSKIEQMIIADSGTV